MSKFQYHLVQCVMWPGYGLSVDWWSLGVLVHELVTGVTPWRHPDIYTLYDMIIDQEFSWDTGELTVRASESSECCHHLHNSVTNPILLAAVISDTGLTGDESEGEDGGMMETTRDFVTKLLVQDVAKVGDGESLISVSSKAFQRLGSGPAGSSEVKNHPWLKCLNWDEVSLR